MAFELPKLPYAYDALEPHIDARTMEIHHTKHHNGYTTNLNNMSIYDRWGNVDMSNAAVRNNGGGFCNHSLFWQIISPNSGGKPSAELAEAVDTAFGSFDAFKDAFSKAAGTRFGSGCAWVCVHKGGKLEIC